MKLIKPLLILTALTVLHQLANAQGCVAIRGNGATCAMTGHDETSVVHSDSWSFGVNSRYFKSFRHFVGTEEQTQREEEGTQVVNHFFSTELSVVRQFNNRWSFALFAPVISNARS